MGDNQKARNFQPKTMVSNREGFANVINYSSNYWAETPDKTSAMLKVNEVARSNNLIFTKNEYDACLKIIKSYRAWKFRNLIDFRIKRKLPKIIK